MQLTLYKQIEAHISAERLSAYASPMAGAKAAPRLVLARYMLNMALCESLYPALQTCEVALRNAIHSHLTALDGP
jgi:hypothetical protein